MEKNYNDVMKILKYILFNQGCTILEIAGAFNFANSYVMDILSALTKDQLHNLKIYYKMKNKKNDVIKEIYEKDIVNKFSWYIKTEKLNAIPAWIFTQEEKRLLDAVIDCCGISKVKEISYSMPDLQPQVSRTTLFLFDIPQTILEETPNVQLLINAIQERRYTKILYSDVNQFFLLRPHGFIRNDITGEWFLIGQDEFHNTQLLLINDIKTIELKENTFTRSINLNREWALKLFDEKKLDITMEIDKFDTVVEKIKHEMGSKGIFMESDNGKIIFQGQTGDIDGFKTFIKRLGSSVKVLNPMWLKEELIEDTKILLGKLEKQEYVENFINE